MLKKEDSLKKRYTAKLAASLIGLALSLVTAGMVPRALGPKNYGNFSFLYHFFSELAGFLSMGTKLAFYTKVSKRPQESGLVAFYLYFTVVVSLVLVAFMGVTHVTSTFKYVWPGQNLEFIYLAVGLAIVGLVIQVLQRMVDAYGLTVDSEIFGIFQRITSTGFIVGLFLLSMLTLLSFFLYSYFMQIILGAGFLFILRRYGYSLKKYFIIGRQEIKKYTKEFYHFSHPLFVYGLVGFIVAILDRWLLQYFGGSVEQGFFSLSVRIGGICFLSTSAMTQLITREFSIAFEKGDITEMRRLFRRYIPLLYAITAYFSCFIAVEANKVTFLLGGENFKQASLALTIMIFFPIHTTYGQLSGSVFYASGQTRLYRNIGSFFMFLGLPVTWVLIAPSDKLGLDGGATGLAIKMVALQFIAVNVQLYFNARFLKLRFWSYLGHQLVNVGCLLGIALISRFLVDTGLGLYDRILSSFFLAGMLYTAMIMLLLYFQPLLFGLKRQDIHSFINSIRIRKKYRLV